MRTNTFEPTSLNHLSDNQSYICQITEACISVTFQVRTGPGSFISHMGGEMNVNLTNVGRYKVRKELDRLRKGEFKGWIT